VVAALAAAAFAFVCIQLAPGDPATALGEGVPEAVRERARAVYGYGDPLLVQFGRWVQAVLRGDFGYSTGQHRAALDVVADAIPNSLAIVLPGLLLALVAGSAIGTWQGVYAGSRRDRALSLVAFVLYALPEFFIALTLLTLFSVVWPLFPSGGVVSDMHVYLSPAAKVADRLRHLVLPSLAVALFGTVTVVRVQRQSMWDAMAQPFVRTALATGLPLHRVYLGAWRASLLPVLTMFGVLLPFAMLGLVFVEQIFAWPGLGLTLFNAINARDYNVVAACIVVQGVLIAVSTVIVDLLREAADPRLVETAMQSAAQRAVRS
jgi:peptide/nickel transport system permease protein